MSFWPKAHLLPKVLNRLFFICVFFGDLIIKRGRVVIPLTGFYLSTLLWMSKDRIWVYNAICRGPRFVFNDWWWELFARCVDIGAEIGDHHRLTFIFMIYSVLPWRGQITEIRYYKLWNFELAYSLEIGRSRDMSTTKQEYILTLIVWSAIIFPLNQWIMLFANLSNLVLSMDVSTTRTRYNTISLTNT
jgi:hypothetical protein